MGLDLVKFKFGKNHGKHKKGDESNYARSTAEALVVHKIGSFSELNYDEKEKATDPVVKVKKEQKGKFVNN